MRRNFTLRATSFGRTELADQAARDQVSLEGMLSLAVLYFVSDLHEGRAAAKLPRFTLDQEDGGEPLEVTVDLHPDTWRVVADQARREGVPVERVLEHAALYYLADAQSGRLARRLANGGGRSSRLPSRARSRAR